MIDHKGNEIVVAWPAHHVLWVEAAMLLPKNQRTEVYQDIADMTGRTLDAVRAKAYWIGEQRHLQQMRIDAARTRLILVAQRAQPGRGRPRLTPSLLTPPSKARLMGCR